MSNPSILITPLVLDVIPEIMLVKVLLPAPFGPNKQNISF